MAVCDVCFRKCNIPAGGTGACRARKEKNGEVVSVNYGHITGFALDSIEKKPLRNFMPGSVILSVGSYGCNLDCPFCQNNEIAGAYVKDGKILYGNGSGQQRLKTEILSPEELRDLAVDLKSRGNIGVAYTYNEPLVGYEYVLDCARLIRDAGMVNVLVSNGCVSEKVADLIITMMDAMNIDLKCFTVEGYRDFLKGDLGSVKRFIEKAAGNTHLEITTLIVPGFNDSDEEMKCISEWISGLAGGAGVKIPLHISRFFPQHRLTDIAATDVEKIYHLADVAKNNLKFVYTGNC